MDLNKALGKFERALQLSSEQIVLHFEHGRALQHGDTIVVVEFCEETPYKQLRQNPLILVANWEENKIVARGIMYWLKLTLASLRSDIDGELIRLVNEIDFSKPLKILKDKR